MSRIGRKLISVPPGVRVSLEPGQITIAGPLGELTKPVPPGITVKAEDSTIEVTRASDSGPVKALHGLCRSVIANMVHGVTTGFRETILLEGVGYRAQVQGNQVHLSVGYSHPVVVPVAQGIRVEAETQSRLVVHGIDKEAVGQFAADLKAVRPMFRYFYKDGRVKGIRLARDVLRYKHQRKMGA